MSFFSQQTYQFKITKTDEECEKASALLEIIGRQANAVTTINWSNGERNTTQLTNLNAGDYSAYISIVHTDSISHFKDTVINFKIEKRECAISVAKYFSPNGDNYNDRLGISNVEKYPNFELEIFNKWGQKIHSQKNNYIPWDGTWNGFELPDGTYYYVLFYDAKDKTKLVKGDITILR